MFTAEAGRPHFRRNYWLRLALATCLVLCAVTCCAQETDLSNLSIEELMNITVTSASKKQQKLNETAAAVYIITQDDIRHSGMTSIPELLRMVPGLSVAQIDANTWAITARGFNGRFANRLLVLIDGRSVYTPTYSGVYWDSQDLLLEDIERIEVIRGPGATMWGANAVNGVINIISKRAQDTQGTLLTSGLSLTDQKFAGVRYGGGLGRDGSFRVYGKYFQRDGWVYGDGSGAEDGWDVARGGFRTDYALTRRDNLTVQGDIYGGTLGQQTYLFGLNPLLTSTREKVGIAGANLLGRWSRASSERSQFSLQSYIDTSRRDEMLVGQRVTTFDVEFQHHRVLGRRHDVVWGLGYQRVASWLGDSPWATFVPTWEGTNLFSSFAQDELRLWRERLRITIGSKFEHNDYTGFEVQPNLRVWLAITPQHHVWAAVSRAIRTPSEAERDVRMDVGSGTLADGTPILAQMFGDRSLVSEKLLAYEAGYRWQAGSRLSFDVAGFYNVFDDATSAQLAMPNFQMTPAPPHLLLPILIANANTQRSFGAELAIKLNVATWWKISGAETWQQVNQQSPVTNPSAGALGRQFSLETPHQQVNVRSSFFLPGHVELDVSSYYVSRLVEQQVPSYVRVDTRLGWRPSRQLELSIGGQNLLQDHHPEYGPVLGFLPTEARRNAYMRATWNF